MNSAPATARASRKPPVVRWVSRPSPGYWYMRWYPDTPIKIVWIGRPYSNDRRRYIREADIGPRFLLAGFLRVHRSARFARVPMPNNANETDNTEKDTRPCRHSSSTTSVPGSPASTS